MMRRHVSLCARTGRSVRTLALSLGTIGSLIAAASCAPQGEPASDAKVIYGEDDRLEVFDAGNPELMVTVAKATVALVKKNQITIENETAVLPNAPITESFNLCEGERFREQPNAAFCSGFLVAPDIIITAGHCIPSASECADISFVFDYAYLQEGQAEVSRLPAGNVFNCRELMARDQQGAGPDYAIVRLDRAVEGRAPLTYRSEGVAEVGSALTVIGHPSGLPTKIAGGASVRTNSHSGYIVANTDTYGGNSGSAVVSTETGQVEGILVRGERDYDYLADRQCYVSFRCENDACRGEDLTAAHVFAEALDEIVNPPPPPDRPTREVVAEGGPVEIPDNDTTGVSIPLTIPDHGPVFAVGVSVKIEHPYIGDIVIILVHPDGTEVELYVGAGNGQNLEATFGLGGSPVRELRVLKDKPSAGEWRVIVRDIAVQDVGRVETVKLTVQTLVPEVEPTPIPEPTPEPAPAPPQPA